MKSVQYMDEEGGYEAMHHDSHAYHGDAGERKNYYVSVGAGQVLDDPEAASYELVIRANDDEVNKLKELFGEYSSMDEAEAFHFTRHPYETNHDETLNRGTDEIIGRIYDLIYELGTEETKEFVSSNRLH